ncbi:glycoside hydrolase [Granulicella cerasi]|uniref:Glycoside hydrolase n=1 Tax=Granulicella cerasi TaxID=741063 RepID=A0ABW1Z528_9BACT|nr:glycoside hydrolase [Granulicella cerasi]
MPITRRHFLQSVAATATVATYQPIAFAEARPAIAGIAYKGEHVRQQIDGFGFSEAFNQSGLLRVLSEKDQNDLLNLMFSPAGGMGYSILRNQIGDVDKARANSGDVPTFEPKKGEFQWAGDENAVWLMNEAKKRGCTRFLSSCWSPPAWMKTNGAVHDSALKKECYQDFAEYLATYVLEYKARFGLDIYAVSPANEPNFTPTLNYGSCKWTGSELSKFVRENLVPTFAAKNVSAKIVVDEHEHWSDEYINVVLDDAANAKSLEIVAAHAYAPNSGDFVSISARTGRFQKALSLGKRVWETEVSVGTGPQITNMNDGVYWARVIHAHMVENDVSAWLYWWGAAFNNTRSGLIWIDSANKKYQLSKRFFTIGQFARFIRPGFHRVDATPNPAPNTYFSAYLSPDAKRLVCVAINDDAVERSFTIQPGGFPATSCIAVRTSTTETHAKLPPVTLQNGSAEVVTAPLSVTTYVFNA